jgi:FAD/FMN-containing dehydrogenase
MRDHFAKLLGYENALDNEFDLLAYSYDASGLQGKARIVLFPENEEEIRQILTWTNRTNIPVIIRGLGANPQGMVVPYNAIVIDMSRFDKILTLNLKEEYVVVQPGVILSDLQKTLRKHGYEFAINPESRRVATIGGLLAMNQMSRQSYKYGRLSKNVLNIEILDGTGKHYPQGDRRFIGLEGVGAIITKARIKIRKIQESYSTSLLDFTEKHELLAELENLKGHLGVCSIEYLDPRISEMLNMKKAHHLLVEYIGEDGEIQNQEVQAGLWKQRANAWSVATKNNYSILEDVTIPEHKLYEFLEWCDERRLPVVGHIANGIMHPFFSDEATQNQREELYEYAIMLGGDAAGQHGYGEVKKAYVPKHIKKLVNELKDEYDYEDIVGRNKLHEYH